MGLFSSKNTADKPAAKAAHRKARAELERVSRRDKSETDAYVRANDKVIEAEERVKRACGIVW